MPFGPNWGGLIGYFRSTKPHLALEENYPDEFMVDIDYEPQLNNDEWLKQYDIIHYHRTIGAYEQMEALNKKFKDLGIVSIMDLDDHWAPGTHHPAYHLIKNAKLDEKIVNNLKLAENITTTTDIFAKEIQKFNKNVFVLPNAIDPTEKQFTPNLEPSNGRIRIGWLGGSCMTPDTEILTENGWVYFPNLEEGVKVATLNPKTNEIEYHSPTGYIKEEYKGDIYNCETKNINFNVTGNHNMYVSEIKNLGHKNLDFKLTMAENVFGKDNHFKKDGVNTNPDVEYFTLPSVVQKPYDKTDYSKKLIKMDDWLVFFGFWLAEGWFCSSNYEVSICQFKSNTYLNTIKRILDSYGINSYFNSDNTVLRTTNRQLYEYCSSFGKANNKFIPREFLNNLSERQLRILLEWYLNGDGSTEKCGDYTRRRGYTVSKQLADDLMEVAFKIGEAASIKNRGKRTPKIGVNENGKTRIITPKYDAYQIGFYSKDSKHNQLTPLVRKEDLTKKYYDGYVYCVEVENHIIHVRRGGKSMWIGNSHLKDLEILNGVVGKLKSDGLLDSIQFVLCGFDLRGTHTEIDSITKEQRTRPIKPMESVWYLYEKIFTDDYKTISPEYKDFLLKFQQIEYPNVANEPYRRVWTKPISTYASNYNLFDISLAPIEEHTFNKVKSQLKVIEAGFHHKAIIAQDFGPYQIDLKNAVQFGGGFDLTGNGILIDKAKNHKDWYANIKKLVNNPDVVKTLQENLYDTVKDLYSINKVTENRRKLYLDLVGNKIT